MVFKKCLGLRLDLTSLVLKK